MALRRWRISKRCCQVVKYLAKEPSIKVEVKSLPQPACLGCKVTVVEHDPAVMLTILVALEHMLPMLLECHRGVAFCRDPTFGGVGTGHMVPAGCSQRFCNRHYWYSRSGRFCYLFLRWSVSGAPQPTGPETLLLTNDVSKAFIHTIEAILLYSERSVCSRWYQSPLVRSGLGKRARVYLGCDIFQHKPQYLKSV